MRYGNPENIPPADPNQPHTAADAAVLLERGVAVLAGARHGAPTPPAVRSVDDQPVRIQLSYHTPTGPVIVSTTRLDRPGTVLDLNLRTALCEALLELTTLPPAPQQPAVTMIALARQLQSQPLQPANLHIDGTSRPAWQLHTAGFTATGTESGDTAIVYAGPQELTPPTTLNTLSPRRQG